MNKNFLEVSFPPQKKSCAHICNQPKFNVMYLINYNYNGTNHRATTHKPKTKKP